MKYQTFDEIQDRLIKIPNIAVNFHDSPYSFGKKLCFPYSRSSAKKILQACVYKDNIFDLLQNNFFEDSLNIFASYLSFQEENPDLPLNSAQQEILETSDFAKSKLSKKDYFETLEIKNWSYKDLISSAAFFYLSIAHLEHLATPVNTKKFSILKPALGEISALFLSPTFGPHLFDTIKKTNIFVKYTYESLFIIILFIEHKTYRREYKIQNCDELNFIIETLFQGDWSGIRYYLSAFDFIIPGSVIDYCSTFCIQTKSISILYYVLQQYKNILNKNLSADEKTLENFALTKSLYEEMSYIKISNPVVGSAVLSVLIVVLSAFAGYPGLSSIGILPLNLASGSGNFQPSNRQPGTFTPVPSKIPVPTTPIKLAKHLQLQRTQTQVQYQERYNSIGWDIEQEESGLFIATNRSLGLFSTIGLSGNFGRMKSNKTTATEFGKANKLKNVCKSQNDHVNPEYLSDLPGLNRSTHCTAITVPDFFNQGKESAPTQISLPTGWRDMLVQEVIIDIQETLETGADHYAHRKNSSEVNALKNYGIWQQIKGFYQDNRPNAVHEMCKTAFDYGLGNEVDATMATLVIPHMLKRLNNLSKIMKQETDYHDLGRTFNIEYLVERTLVYTRDLTVLMQSAQRLLNPKTSSAYNRYIDMQMKGLHCKVVGETFSAISRYDRYQNELDFPKLSLDELHRLEKKAYQKFHDIDTGIHQLYPDLESLLASPEFQGNFICHFRHNENPTLLVKNNVLNSTFVQLKILDASNRKNGPEAIQQESILVDPTVQAVVNVSITEALAKADSVTSDTNGNSTQNAVTSEADTVKQIQKIAKLPSEDPKSEFRLAGGAIPKANLFSLFGKGLSIVTPEIVDKNSSRPPSQEVTGQNTVEPTNQKESALAWPDPGQARKNLQPNEKSPDVYEQDEPGDIAVSGAAEIDAANVVSVAADTHAANATAVAANASLGAGGRGSEAGF